MMRCLCCYEEIIDEDGVWHKACVRRFFGVAAMPSIDLSESGISDLVSKQLGFKRSVTGVQKKISPVFKYEKGVSRLTVTGRSNQHIVKPDTDKYPNIAECEFTVMHLANAAGIRTPLFGLINMPNGRRAYITRRMDRGIKCKIHMEDFAQLSGRGTEYKYNSSYEKCLKIIERYSTHKTYDSIEFIYRLMFSYITLNSDMHLKNFSFLEDELGTRLSPAYDLLPVQLIFNDDEETALSLNGKKTKLRLKDFIELGANAKISKKVIVSLANKLIALKDKFIDEIKISLLTDEEKEKFISTMSERLDRLSINKNNND